MKVFEEGNREKGFSLIELLVVIAIIGILATLVLLAVNKSRLKAYDVRIKNGISQLRWQAEIVYDTQGASYLDWSQNADIQDEINTLLEDIDKNYGDAPGAPYVGVIRDSQPSDYCISAPLRSEEGKYICIDRSAVVQYTDGPCPDYSDTDPPLLCADAGM